MEIIEKKLGIPPDYQYKALRSENFLQANWHNNKLVVLSFILNLTGAKKILDLGTGSGNFELTFAKKVNQIVGVDYNDEAIEFLRTKLGENKIKNVYLITEDIRNVEKIKYSEKFDLAIIVDVIEHLKIADAAKLVFKLKKLLKRDGKVCIITPNYKSFWLIIEKFLDKFTVFPHMDKHQHLAKFYEENLRKMFIKNGYLPLFFSTFNLFSFLFFNKSVSSKLCRMELALKLPFGNLLVYLFEVNPTSRL